MKTTYKNYTIQGNANLGYAILNNEGEHYDTTATFKEAKQYVDWLEGDIEVLPTLARRSWKTWKPVLVG